MYRKFFTEFGLVIYTSHKAIMPLEYVYEYRDDHVYNIYVITCKPRTYIQTDSLAPAKESITLNLELRNNDKTTVITANDLKPIPFIDYMMLDYSLMRNDEVLRITAEEAYIRSVFDKNQVKFDNSAFRDGKFIINIESSYLLDMHYEKTQTVQNYEVLYIGQSFGKDGKRTAQERLTNHSTLQKILTKFLCERREDSIYVFLFEVNVLNQMSMDGFNQDSTADKVAEDKHFHNVFDHAHDFNQIVNIFEAALINHFKPEFNIKLIDNFPNFESKGYQDYFSLDYNSLVAELDLEFDSGPIIRLITENAEMDWINRFIKYKLFNDPNRKDMMDIFKKAEE